MPDATNTSQVISSDIIPFGAIAFGAIMLVIVVLIHGAGLGAIGDVYARRTDLMRQRARAPQMATVAFASAIFLMLVLHLGEIVIWGWVLHAFGLIRSVRDSMYFSANTYTTIGYGKMILPDDWRELSPIMAISGLFTFAWTTGQMFEFVGEHRRLGKDLARMHRARKGSAGHEMARTMAAAAGARTATGSSGLSAVEKAELYREIEARLARLRDAERHEHGTA